MISGANEQELELANARANIIMKLDNTSTYESWLIIDTYLEQLEKENQELKKQIEEKDILIKQCELSVSNVMDCYCERTDCSGRIKDSKVYDSLVQKVETQQKEFIKYLEDENKKLDVKANGMGASSERDELITKARTYREILQKYKEITGVSDENNKQ